MSERREAALPHLIDTDAPDAEVAALVESWRYRGAHVPWDAIVGHSPQIRRCQEVVEALRRTDDELEHLNIRLGRGLVLSGPAGVGKTLIARAIAGSIGRDVIAPPVAELTPGLIARLYAHLARIDPTIVVLDEAERVVGHGYEIDEDLLAVIAERYVITDPIPRRALMERTIAIHEASHAVYAYLHWPEDVEYLSLSGIPSTRLRESLVDALNDVAGYRNLAGFALAGLAGEIVALGPEMVTSGASRDRASATDHLLMVRHATQPFDQDVLEGAMGSNRGSERMRAAEHAWLEAEAARTLTDAVATLAPRRAAIERLADALLQAEDVTLSGVALEEAIKEAIADEGSVASARDDHRAQGSKDAWTRDG